MKKLTWQDESSFLVMLHCFLRKKKKSGVMGVYVCNVFGFLFIGGMAPLGQHLTNL
jgi:hypothetical protein